MEGGGGYDQQQASTANDLFDRDFADFNYKLILVGHQRVGKTSIISRFVNDMFNDNEQSSTCMQIMKKLIKIEKTDTWAQLHIWDTLGQETYKSMSPIFFRKAIGVFLVFDCTSMESFLALDGWFESMSQTIDSKVLIMLLGNKCDLPHREVPYNLAMEYARRRNFGFLEVSAKTGANIKNSFNGLVREIYRNQANASPSYVEQKLNNEPISSNDMRAKGKSIKLNSQLHQHESDEEESYSKDQSKKSSKKSKKKNKDKNNKCMC